MALVFDEGSTKTPSHVFWTEKDNEPDVSDSSDAYVPGVNDVGNRRPHRINQWKTREARVSVHKPGMESKRSRLQRIEMKPPKGSAKKDMTGSSIVTEESGKGHSRQPSLKDLCPEDKQRVANLIKELAKVGEEKEKAVEQMHQERVNFEKEILKLLEQQESVLNERQIIQSQLLLCQQALSVYQQKLTEREQDDDKKKRDVQIASHGERSVRRNLGEQSSRSKVIEAESDEKTQEQTTQRKDGKPRSIDEIPSSGHKGDKSRRANANIDSDEDLEGFKAKGSSKGSKVTSHDKMEPHKDDLQRFETERLANVHDRLSNNFRELDLMKQTAKEKDDFRTPPLSKTGLRKHKGHGPLPEPVMSSTQKSSEIIAEMSFKSRSSADNYFPLQSDSSLPTRDNLANSFPGRYPTSGQYQGRKLHRGDFAPKDQYCDNSGPFHSPNLAGRNSDKFSDPDFIAYYRKLSSKERKQELLSQRNVLLGEQKRLRRILREQEEMLKVKRDQLHHQQIVQAQRLAHFEETGVFPLANDERLGSRHPKMILDEADLTNGEDVLQFQELGIKHEEDKHNVGKVDVLGHNVIHGHTEAGQDAKSDHRVRFQTVGEIKGGNLSSKTSRLPTDIHSVEAVDPPFQSPHRGHLVSMATSPMNTEHDGRVKIAATSKEAGPTSPRQPVGSPRGHADAATSCSNLSGSSLDRAAPSKQGNLPLMTNRQKTSEKTYLNTSGDKKGFSVLEILEKLESEAGTSHTSNGSVTAHGNGSWSSKGHHCVLTNNSYTRTLSEVSEDESLAELEESKVLEDVFFLK